MKNLWKFSLFILCLDLSAQKEVEANAKIDFVTVYTSAAELSYQKELQLHKGKTTVVFTDLTPFIVENSVNVEVSNPNVNIIMVAERINYSKERRQVNEKALTYTDSIAKLKKELSRLLVRSEVVEVEKRFTHDALDGMTSKGVSLDEIIKASMFLNKRYNELTKDYHDMLERRQELQERITKYEKDLKEAVTVSVKTMSELKITVDCKGEEKVNFKFRFLTQKGGWAPVYDFKYEGPDKPLQFVFRANVFNACGTSWQDVNMKLTTSDPLNGFKLPSLGKTSAKDRTEDGVKFKTVDVANAVTEYSISHEYTIPSDAKPYAIDVSSSAMPASFYYILIPKMDAYGFLMAKIPAWNGYNLIPATANFYNMGTYMGKTFLDTYSDNDTLNVFLGKDKNLMCSKTEKTIDHKRFFVGNFSTENTSAAISIKNHSQFALAVEVLDQVPVIGKDDKEKMFVHNLENAIYDRNDGLIVWRLNLKGNETTSIDYSYEIKTPKEDYEYGGYGGFGRPKKRMYRTISCPAF